MSAPKLLVNNDADPMEIRRLREEVAALRKEKERLCDVLLQTTNALIRNMKEKR